LYEYIKGKIEFISPEYIVVENGDIGYQIKTPNPFSFSSYTGAMTTIYIYHYVREDNVSLYGFKSREERELFTKLLNVSGIGPKGALAILASGEPSQVIAAIENEDEGFLVKFPGVGKKTARQMILDLKGKLADFMPEYLPNIFNVDEHLEKVQNDSALDEALLALTALGYSERELKKITPQLKKEVLNTDEYIKLALKLLLK